MAQEKILAKLLAQCLILIMIKGYNFENKLKRSIQYRNQGNNHCTDFMPYFFFQQDGTFGAVLPIKSFAMAKFLFLKRNKQDDTHVSTEYFFSLPTISGSNKLL